MPSYRSNRPTNKHTNRQDRLQYTAPLSLARSVITDLEETHARKMIVQKKYTITNNN